MPYPDAAGRPPSGAGRHRLAMRPAREPLARDRTGPNMDAVANDDTDPPQAMLKAGRGVLNSPAGNTEVLARAAERPGAQ